MLCCENFAVRSSNSNLLHIVRIKLQQTLQHTLQFCMFLYLLHVSASVST